MFVLNYRQRSWAKFGISSFAIYSEYVNNLHVKMVKSQNNETTHEIKIIIKDVLDKIMNKVGYEGMG